MREVRSRLRDRADTISRTHQKSQVIIIPRCGRYRCGAPVVIDPRRLFVALAHLLFAALFSATVAHAQESGRDTTRKDSVVRPVPGQFEGSSRSGSEDPNLAPGARLRARIQRDSLALRHYMDSLNNTPLAIMKRNLALNASDWMPTAADRRRRDEMIRQTQSWGNPADNMPRVGVSVPLQAIGRMLGLIEDVTPRIYYTLMNTQYVTVIIYDLRAEKVATVIDGVQAPGVYDFKWDLLDSTGHPVPSGDYIAEVIAEKRLLLRKRIEIP
jgi:hypothetical protein